MSSSENPYGPPSAIPPIARPPLAGELGGLWRQGNVLVMDKNAPLPDICMKSGVPTALRLKRNLQWHHPAITVTILAGLLVYVILALVLTKRATLDLPLAQRYLDKRKRALLLAWGFALGGIGLFIGGIAAASNQSPLAILIPVGMVIFLGAIIYGNYGARLVYPKKIDEQYVWLRGVGPEFLCMLPVWPYG